MGYLGEIRAYQPENAQEAADKRGILSFAARYPDTVLLRENTIGHITSSGFILNRALDKVLLIHHNIRNAWAWTGGHADGDADLLHVAIKEAAEETGVSHIVPQTGTIAALDILPVFGHMRRGEFVTAHLHLSVAYILLCDECEKIRPRPSENSAVGWFDLAYFTEEHFEANDVRLYNKLIRRARQTGA